MTSTSTRGDAVRRHRVRTITEEITRRFETRSRRHGPFRRPTLETRAVTSNF